MCSIHCCWLMLPSIGSPHVPQKVVGELGGVLVTAARVQPGERVLDVAAGSGNASLPAAAAGASVVATDLTPELVEIGRQRAASQGLDVAWREADAEHLGFDNAEFDVVMSCVGVMFAPFHQPVADELARVTRPGGRIALINWTPQGFIGQMFAAMKPFAPAPPAGATPGPLWGDEDHVRSLFGDFVADLRAERRILRVDRFTSGSEFRDFFASFYGPTIAACRNVADDPDRSQPWTVRSSTWRTSTERAAASWNGSTFSSSPTVPALNASRENRYVITHEIAHRSSVGRTTARGATLWP